MLQLACQGRGGHAWLQARPSQPQASPFSVRHWGCGAACRGSHGDVAGWGCADPGSLRDGHLWLGRVTCSACIWSVGRAQRGELRGAVLTPVCPTRRVPQTGEERRVGTTSMAV